MGLFTKLSAVPALQIVGAYTADDVVGGLLTFANAASAYASEGVIKRLKVIDADQEDAALVLWLFTASPAAAAKTDADAFAPVAADLAKVIGAIAIPAAGYVDGDSASVQVIELDFPFVLPASTTSLYGVLVCDATPTYTAVNDLTVDLVVSRR